MKLDMLVVIRTAPDHSYINVVEHIMSILNIGLQNVALHWNHLRLMKSLKNVTLDRNVQKCRNQGRLD